MYAIVRVGGSGGNDPFDVDPVKPRAHSHDLPAQLVGGSRGLDRSSSNEERKDHGDLQLELNGSRPDPALKREMRMVGSKSATRAVRVTGLLLNANQPQLRRFVLTRLPVRLTSEDRVPLRHIEA